ncbi:PotD/PotF family extracellular solute-binding protein [Oceanicola sp. 22II-s10i]|uniref:ABC transporter substrate-binding protein n=1 Tax=Oceanicola sp. 22II-s10i TaxID=1317116 RepID=UPI0015954830|nr:extracellular solute-binding protein [Oceanicola sp. 22II-s10i]
MKSFNLDRRQFLAGSAGLVATSMAAPAGVLAQSQSISALMPGVLLPESLRGPAEAATGAAIENLPYVSPTDTVAKLLAPGAQGRYDLINNMMNFVTEPLMAADALQPLDLSKVPNWDQLSPYWQSQAVMKDGEVYMIPCMWAYDSVLYNKDFIPEDDEVTQSWGVMFDDRYAGRIAPRDDAYQMITLTALHLGVEEPATMSRSDIKEIQAFLISKKANFRTLWSSFGEAVNLMSSQEVWAMVGWMPMRLALQKQGMNVTNNWPSEGLMTFQNGLFIPKGSQKTDLAHAAANFFISQEYASELAKLMDYGVTNEAVINGFSQETIDRVGYDIFDRGVKTYPYTWPAEMDAWIEAWNSFKVA